MPVCMCDAIRALCPEHPSGDGSVEPWGAQRGVALIVLGLDRMGAVEGARGLGAGGSCLAGRVGLGVSTETTSLVLVS